MMKIFLVDDEERVRSGLKDTIEWEKYDFKIVGEAENGEEALRSFAEVSPDVVITDIQMPKMDGLTLIAKTQELYPDTEFIILTGYSYFDYAKRAIDMGIAHYLLKPIRNEDLINILKKISEKQARNKKQNLAMQNYIAQQQNNFMLKLLSEPSESVSADEISKSFGITLPNQDFFLCELHIDLNNNAENDVHLLSLNILLKDSIDYCIASKKIYAFTSMVHPSNMTLLVFLNDPAFEINSFLETLCSEFYNQSGFTVSIGVSGIFRNLDMIKRAYSQARRALSRRVLLGNNRIIHYTSMNKDISNPVLSDAQVQNIINFVLQHNSAEAKAVIDDYLNHLSVCDNETFSEAKNTLTELSVLVIRAVAKTPSAMKLTLGRIVRPAIEVQECEFLSDLHDWINTIIDKASEYSDSLTLSQYKPSVAQAIRLIQFNYSLPISIEWIAEQINTSTRTLTRQFKSETGQTFVEYLSFFRIKMAVYILRNESSKVAQVGELVGYPNTKYFLKIFKRITGHTPTYFIENPEAEF